MAVRNLNERLAVSLGEMRELLGVSWPVAKRIAAEVGYVKTGNRVLVTVSALNGWMKAQTTHDPGLSPKGVARTATREGDVS